MRYCIAIQFVKIVFRDALRHEKWIDVNGRPLCSMNNARFYGLYY